jgi:hypothetical protein
MNSSFLLGLTIFYKNNKECTFRTVTFWLGKTLSYKDLCQYIIFNHVHLCPEQRYDYNLTIMKSPKRFSPTVGYSHSEAARKPNLEKYSVYSSNSFMIFTCQHLVLLASDKWVSTKTGVQHCVYIFAVLYNKMYSVHIFFHIETIFGGILLL